MTEGEATTIQRRMRPSAPDKRPEVKKSSLQTSQTIGNASSQRSWQRRKQASKSSVGSDGQYSMQVLNDPPGQGFAGEGEGVGTGEGGFGVGAGVGGLGAGEGG